MAVRKKVVSRKKLKAASKGISRPVSSVDDQVKAALVAIKAASSEHDRQNMARFGIVTPKFFGVSMANLKVQAKRFGRSHELAAGLWNTGWYEARMLATLVDEPDKVTPVQMDRWCRDFDNWGICDTACFCLFDRTPHAFAKVRQWSEKSGEFQKRAAFALLASLCGHDKVSDDQAFVDCLPLIERAAADERNFVKKGVNWALRSMGRRGPELRAAAVVVAKRLAALPDATPRWVGKDALRDLTKVR